MRPSEKARAVDVPSLALLGWVGIFGTLYAWMAIECKLPTFARLIRELAGRVFSP